MTDVIQIAKTGRSKCRGCGRGIALHQLRFGESLPSPYTDVESLYWFHLACAACMRPEKLLAALADSPEPIEEREWLEKTGRLGLEHPRLARLARAERAASGRARCRICQEAIEKGHARLALHAYEDGRFSPLGSIHVECSEAYFGRKDLLDRLERLQTLEDSLRKDLEERLAQQRPVLPGPPIESAEAGPTEARGLAKTQAPSDGRAKRAAT